MQEAKVFLQKFFAKYGIFFVMIYIASFFIYVTFLGGTSAPVIFGDIRFEVFGSFVYLPFSSAFVTAITITIVFQVYRSLKS